LPQTRSVQSDDNALFGALFDIISSKKAIALVAGLAVVLGFVFYLAPDDSKPQLTRNNYLPAATHAPAAAKLLTLSGMTEKSFESFDTELVELFERELPLRANPQGAKKEDVLSVLGLSKRAYNGEAALISLRNSLSLSLTEEQVSEVSVLYQQPLIRRALEDVKNNTSDYEAYRAFANGLESAPIGPRRLRALGELATVTQYDKLLLAIWSAGQITLAELVGITINRPIPVRERRKVVLEVKDMANVIEPAIRQEAINQLAWMYKDYSLFQLGDLATSYDKPEFVRFNSEVRAGIKSYFALASQWVKNEHSKSDL